MKKVFYPKKYHMLLIPSILIRAVDALLLIITPYLQEFFVQSSMFIRKRKQDPQIELGGKLDE
ncbi:MAG: hypothetical protein L0H53_14130 [Candidatus Nitrosocosmicus sp.]|nr:hypothetical protein [Candidatus Nitrosocosmicus sp.]MDN5868482.1 hypothetical protein [Candidatus Nitrosocosmicus sp.]